MADRNDEESRFQSREEPGFQSLEEADFQRFRTPPAEVLESLRTTASALGIDSGLIGRPEHCCRLPGQCHLDTGIRSRVMWLGGAER